MLMILAYYLLYGMVALIALMTILSAFPIETTDFMLFLKVKILKGEVEPTQSKGEIAADVLRFVLLWPLALFLISILALLYYIEITGKPHE